MLVYVNIGPEADFLITQSDYVQYDDTFRNSTKIHRSEKRKGIERQEKRLHDSVDSVLISDIMILYLVIEHPVL